MRGEPVRLEGGEGLDHFARDRGLRPTRAGVTVRRRRPTTRFGQNSRSRGDGTLPELSRGARYGGRSGVSSGGGPAPEPVHRPRSRRVRREPADLPPLAGAGRVPLEPRARRRAVRLFALTRCVEAALYFNG